MLHSTPGSFFTYHAGVVYIHFGGALGKRVSKSSFDLLSSDLVMGHDCLHPANILCVILVGEEEKPPTCITLGAMCCCSANDKSTGGYFECIDSIISELILIVSKNLW